VIKCPKKLRTGPCGGVRENKCEITGNICYFMATLNKKETNLPLTNIHPIIRENEALIREKVPPVASEYHKSLLERKGVSVELPISLIHNSEDIKEILNATKGKAQLYTIPDNPLGYPHVSSTSLATFVKTSFNDEVMPHLTCKDKNLSGLTSELLIALLFEFEDVLLNTGDWPSFAIPSKPVFDLDAYSLIRLAYQVFHGVLPTKQEIEVENRPRIAVGFNPYYKPKIEARRIQKKILTGAEVFFSQVVASIEAITNIDEIFKEVKKIGLKGPVVASLLHPIGEKEKSFLTSLGVSISDETLEDLIEEIKAQERINGLNLIISAPDMDGWIEEFFAVWDILRDSGFRG